MTEDSHNAGEAVPVDAHNQYQQYPPNEGPTGGNSNGHTSAVIELELTEEVQKEQIVATGCFLYNFRSKSVNLKLNHKYENKWIDSPVDLKDLKQTNEEFRDILKSNGVTIDDITKLENMFISNNKRIVDHYYQQMLEQTNTGQRNKKERVDRIKNAPPREVSVSEALVMRDGNVRVKGMFVGGSVKVENMIIRIGFRCGDCDDINLLADYSDTRPRLTSEIPSTFTPRSLNKHKCKNGCEGTIAHTPYEDIVSARRVELHDTETSGDPPNINVILFNDYALETEYTEQVIITGSIQRVRVKDKLLPHIFVGLGSDGSTTNGFNPVEYMDKRESTEITPDDEKKIQEFLIQNKGRELDALVDLVAPSHIGHKDAKKGLLICAVNSGIDSVRRKRRFNVLFLGETGLDKSGLARDGNRLVPGSKFASATDSTTNSLICVVDGDTGHYRYGPLVTASGAMCVIDEIGRMPKDEQARLLSILQEGVVNFGRFGFTRELEASAGVILTANPDSISGKFRYPNKIDPNEFPFLGPFKNRIDLIFIFRTNRDRDYLWNYARNKTEVMDNYSSSLKKEGNNSQYLVKHILYAKKCDPQFSQEAEPMLNQYFVDVMTPEDSEASNRLWETLRNLCHAIARLKLKDTIDVEDVTEIIEFYNRQLKYWSQIVNIPSIPSDPRDTAYQEIIKKLTGQKFAVEFEQLLQAVCKDNVCVSEYIGFNKEGKRDWNVRTNRKVRQIRDKFTKGPRDDRILILGISPLTIAWHDTYTGGDKEVSINVDAIDDYDESDMSGASDISGKRNEEISDNSSNTNIDTNTDTKPEISNEDLIPDVTHVTHVTLPNESSNTEPSKQELIKESSNIDSTKSNTGNTGNRGDLGKSKSEVISYVNSTIPKVVHNEPSEDYEAYVAKQAKKVAAIEKEEQKSTASRIFDELMLNRCGMNPGMEKEVLESKFRAALISNGKFNEGDIDVIIEDMENDGIIERICTELDGVLCDILRRKSD
jgi:DNA replicative helicase MCM subunit Mcm2 (Cdc46/Mcm family)